MHIQLGQVKFNTYIDYKIYFVIECLCAKYKKIQI